MAANCNFAIIGGGWRAEFFVRASRGTGGAFVCQGVNSRRPERREEWGRRLGMATFGSIDETLDHNPDFLVVSVPRESAVAVVEEIFQKSKVPVLLETPPGLEVAELRRAWGLTRAGAKVQVAEQYRWQPHHAARIALLNRGLLGERYEATVSVAHGYHAASLLSEYLGLQGNEWQRLSVTARRLVSRVIPGPGRGGPPADAAPVPSERTVAVLSDGKKHGIYDFDGEQYFSEIRSQHVAVRGERGELRDDLVSYIPDGGAWRATQDHLVRVEGGQGGDLHLLGLREIRFRGEPVYSTPAYVATLSDEEIAIAQCLDSMARYVGTGEEFYTVERGCRDRYVELALLASAAREETVSIDIDGWKQGKEVA